MDNATKTAEEAKQFDACLHLVGRFIVLVLAKPQVQGRSASLLKLSHNQHNYPYTERLRCDFHSHYV